MPFIRRRSSTNGRHQSRQRSPIIPIVLAVVFVGTIAAAGFTLYRDRHWTAPPVTASPAASTVKPVGNQAPGAPLPPPAAPACGDDGELLAQMSPRDKLAQLLMVGVTGAADARDVVAKHHVGGIFIGGWTDLSMLRDNTLPEITADGPLPLAVSVDEEGGRVDRLASLIGPAPSARSLAESESPDAVYEQAKQRGLAMQKLGITVDFAPVADVSDQPADTVIGDRSFSNDPDAVTQYAGAYARGLRDAGLLPVLKHFPGHGHGSGDSHTGAVVTPPLEALKNDDLVPYRTLLDQGRVAVMVGHLQVPGLTGDLPASLSPAAIGLLRTGDYGAAPFDGPVFTDDLSSMRAIADRYGVAQSVLMALQAGADTALWITTDEVPAVLDRLEAAVNGGELTIDDVNQKVLRMAGVKGRNSQCGR
jgi:beta-N-acetylhexosaminidase